MCIYLYFLNSNTFAFSVCLLNPGPRLSTLHTQHILHGSLIYSHSFGTTFMIIPNPYLQFRPMTCPSCTQFSTRLSISSCAWDILCHEWADSLSYATPEPPNLFLFWVFPTSLTACICWSQKLEHLFLAPHPLSLPTSS